MAILKAEAVVLKTFNFRETSLIVNFFSLEYGRLSGILKGIRADPKKFASSLEPFSVNDIIFYQKRNSELHLVSQCDLKNNFNNIRKSLDSIACSSYMTELINSLMPQEEKNEPVYRLYVHALNQIDIGGDPEKISRIFLVKFLKLIGFKPRLNACIICDGNIGHAAYFNVKRGGLLCTKCKNVDTYSTTVFKGTIQSLVHIEESAWQEALRLGLNATVKEELNRILNSFMEFHLQIRPKSRDFMEMLK